MEKWGNDITIIVVSDYNFLPGVYALFNSFICNGFNGKLRVVKAEDFDSKFIFNHPQIEIDVLEREPGNFHFNVQRFNYFKELRSGKYLFLDADILIERPLDFLTELLDQSILVSRESEAKYDANDIMYQRQSLKAGYDPFENKEIGYINGGLIGFSLPQHKIFIDELLNKSFTLLSGMSTYTQNPDWFFIDQDMLNVVLRNIGVPVSVISPRILELGRNCLNESFYKRPFPYQKQTKVFPKDQLKYIIHGASLRRPWINPSKKSFVQQFKNKLCSMGITGLIKTPTPYERAWAYYACREDLPIPLSCWCKQHNFTAYKNFFWRKVHDLT